MGKRLSHIQGKQARIPDPAIGIFIDLLKLVLQRHINQRIQAGRQSVIQGMTMFNIRAAGVSLSNHISQLICIIAFSSTSRTSQT